MAIRRIGQILVDLGFLTDEQLEMLLEEQQQRPGEMLGQIAISMGLITDEQLAQALAEQMGMQVVSLERRGRSRPRCSRTITEPMAQLYRIIPLSFEDNTLTIAMCDPQKLSIIDELRSFLGYDIKAMVCTEKEMLKALERYYAAGGESVETLIADMEQDAELAAAVEAMEKSATVDLTSVEALADSAPVRKLLNMVLLLAIRTTPATCTSSRSRTSSRSASGPTACCTRWCRRRGTWPSPSPRASRSWPTSTSPSGACRRTAASG